MGAIQGNRITKPGEYQLTNDIHTLTIKETEGVTLLGDANYIYGLDDQKQPDINLIKAENVSIKGVGESGLILNRTRIKAQAYSKNLEVENVTFFNSHISSISAKTEWHVDKGEYFSDQNPWTFFWDYCRIKNVRSYNPVNECFYIGSQKYSLDMPPHYFERVEIHDCEFHNSGREFGQVAHVYSLSIKNLSCYNSGRNKEAMQDNGIQVSDCRGLISNVSIDRVEGYGLILFSYDLKFKDIKINNPKRGAIFIGQVNKRFPQSALNTGKPLVFQNLELSNCEYAFDVQTDEMPIYIINPIIHTTVENMFHPNSKRDNVIIIDPIYR